MSNQRGYCSSDLKNTRSPTAVYEISLIYKHRENLVLP